MTPQIYAFVKSLLEKLIVTYLVEIRFLWNLKVHNRVHKSTLSTPILNHFKLVHTFTPCFCKIHFNCILYTPTHRQCSVDVFRPKICMHFSFVSYVLHVPPIQ
jgi:Fe-S-cluster containining protein